MGPRIAIRSRSVRTDNFRQENTNCNERRHKEQETEKNRKIEKFHRKNENSKEILTKNKEKINLKWNQALSINMAKFLSP